jgi:hypothetical protein
MVPPTTKAATTSSNTQKLRYTLSLILYNFRLVMICNHLVGFLVVSVTWCPALLNLLGVCYGSQGQDDVRRHLQP